MTMNSLVSESVKVLSLLSKKNLITCHDYNKMLMFTAANVGTALLCVEIVE